MCAHSNNDFGDRNVVQFNNLQTDQNFRYVCDSSFIRYVMRNQWTTLSFVFRPQLKIL